MKLPRKHLALGSVTLLVILMATSGCRERATSDSSSLGKTNVSSMQSASKSLRFEKAVQRNLPAFLELTGSLVAEATSEVAAPVAGLVTKVNVDMGDRVKKGDILVSLDTRESALRAAQSYAQVNQSWARLGVKPGEKYEIENVPDVRVAKEAYELAASEETRGRALLQSGTITQQTYDALKSRATQAKAQYESALSGAQQAVAALSSSQASASLAAKILADNSIRAPFDGAIAEKRINVGEWAQVGRILVVAVQDHPLRLRFEIPEAEVPQVTLGAKMQIVVASAPNRTFEGTVKRLGASINAQSRSLPAEAEVLNGDGALKPGLFVQAQLVTNQAKQSVVMVPEKAVRTINNVNRIFVRVGERIAERLIKLGRRAEGFVEVPAGVQVGDEVVVEQLDQLSDGMTVSVAQ